MRTFCTHLATVKQSEGSWARSSAGGLGVVTVAKRDFFRSIFLPINGWPEPPTRWATRGSLGHGC